MGVDSGTVEVTADEAVLVCRLGPGGALLQTTGPVLVGDAGLSLTGANRGILVNGEKWIPGGQAVRTGLESFAPPPSPSLYAIAVEGTAEVAYLAPEGA